MTDPSLTSKGGDALKISRLRKWCAAIALCAWPPERRTVMPWRWWDLFADRTVDGFVRSLVVERDADNPTRLNVMFDRRYAPPFLDDDGPTLSLSQLERITARFKARENEVAEFIARDESVFDVMAVPYADAGASTTFPLAGIPVRYSGLIPAGELHARTFGGAMRRVFPPVVEGDRTS